MFKRTNGYVLLTLLVLTGFAGRVTNETLHSKERRFLIASLKENRTELLTLVKGLSDQQLDYRPAKGVLTIREHLYHIVAAENAFNTQAQSALKQPASPEHAAKGNDKSIPLKEMIPTVRRSWPGNARSTVPRHFLLQKASKKLLLNSRKSGRWP
jgi:hypothetical protein